MKEEIQQLIEDYQRRLKNTNGLIDDEKIFGIDDVTRKRLQGKAESYRTFISELEKIINNNDK